MEIKIGELIKSKKIELNKFISQKYKNEFDILFGRYGIKEIDFQFLNVSMPITIKFVNFIYADIRLWDDDLKLIINNWEEFKSQLSKGLNEKIDELNEIYLKEEEKKRKQLELIKPILDFQFV